MPDPFHLPDPFLVKGKVNPNWARRVADHWLYLYGIGPYPQVTIIDDRGSLNWQVSGIEAPVDIVNAARVEILKHIPDMEKRRTNA